MPTKTNANSWVKQFVAVLTGDDATVQAEKAFRQAKNALESQIAALKFETMSKEDEVSKKEEKLCLARINNGQPLESKEKYAQNLIDSKNAALAAQQALDTHKKKITFFEDELKSLEKEA